MSGLRFDMIREGTVEYSDEATLRGGFAALAYTYGWTVRQEVVIPKWGRLDLVIDHPQAGWAIPVEFKLDLDRPALVRKAFAQADGYARWLRVNDDTVIAGPDCKVVLCAPGGSLDWDSIGPLGRLYHDTVRFMTGGTLMELIRCNGDREWSGRSGAAPILHRVTQIENRLRFYEAQVVLFQAAWDEVAARAEDQRIHDEAEQEAAAAFFADNPEQDA